MPHENVGSSTSVQINEVNISRRSTAGGAHGDATRSQGGFRSSGGGSSHRRRSTAAGARPEIVVEHPDTWDEEEATKVHSTPWRHSILGWVRGDGVLQVFINIHYPNTGCHMSLTAAVAQSVACAAWHCGAHCTGYRGCYGTSVHHIHMPRLDYQIKTGEYNCYAHWQ